jgi:hopanoid biosynthesis associated protein HpnK
VLEQAGASGNAMSTSREFDTGEQGDAADAAACIVGREAVKQLIVTADDFGLALPVNEAIEEAHRRGILSAASLMVTAAAEADAVARAKRLPQLGIGLHLVLVDGRPALPPEEIPDLVGPDGRFPSNPTKAGIDLFFRPRARAQLEREIRAQLELFRRTGLPLDHVNSHHHFHVHPTIAAALVRLAPEYGIKAVRVPSERPIESWRATSDRLGARLVAWASQSPWAASLRRRLVRAGIRFNDRVLGLSDTGDMRAERVARYLARLPDGVSELYVHAATGRWDGPDVWPPHYACRGEFEALIDERVVATLRQAGIQPITFAALAPMRS